MLDFCWISRRGERPFVWEETLKTPADLVVRVVGGDGFEPPTLRCKCDSEESRYQQESAFPLLSSVFQGVVIVPSVAWSCARPRTIRGLESEWRDICA